MERRDSSHSLISDKWILVRRPLSVFVRHFLWAASATRSISVIAPLVMIDFLDRTNHYFEEATELLRKIHFESIKFEDLECRQKNVLFVFYRMAITTTTCGYEYHNTVMKFNQNSDLKTSPQIMNFILKFLLTTISGKFQATADSTNNTWFSIDKWYCWGIPSPPPTAN